MKHFDACPLEVRVPLSDRPYLLTSANEVLLLREDRDKYLALATQTSRENVAASRLGAVLQHHARYLDYIEFSSESGDGNGNSAEAHTLTGGIGIGFMIGRPLFMVPFPEINSQLGNATWQALGLIESLTPKERHNGMHALHKKGQRLLQLGLSALEEVPEIDETLRAIIEAERVPCSLEDVFRSGVGLEIHFLLHAYNAAQFSIDMQVMDRLNEALSIGPDAVNSPIRDQLGSSSESN